VKRLVAVLVVAFCNFRKFQGPSVACQFSLCQPDPTDTSYRTVRPLTHQFPSIAGAAATSCPCTCTKSSSPAQQAALPAVWFNSVLAAFQRPTYCAQCNCYDYTPDLTMKDNATNTSKVHRFTADLDSRLKMRCRTAPGADSWTSSHPQACLGSEIRIQTVKHLPPTHLSVRHHVSVTRSFFNASSAAP
jgi:hypothetical protein